MDTIDELGRRAARTALAEAEAYTDVEAGLARIRADEEDVDWNVDGGSRRGWVVVLAAAAAVVAAVTASVVWSQEDPSPRLVPGTSPEVTPAPTTPATPEPTTPATPAPTTPTTEAPTTTTPPTTTSLPPDDSSPLATLAEAIGASTAIATEPGKVSVFTAGTTSEVATPRDAYVQTDGDFLWWYIITGETMSRSAAATLDGTIVCEVDGTIHRVRQEADGGYVASVERRDEITGIGEEIAVPNYAVDCDTGAIEPIEPVSWRWEVGTRRIERIGDSTFTSSHDAEGNGDVTNEAGISINGDDYAGYHTFSADGSRVVYGDMDALATPHVTNVLRSRDTTTGELLWSAELDRPVGLTYWYGDRIVALAPADGVPGGPYEAVIVLDALTGDVIETVPTTLDLAFVE